MIVPLIWHKVNPFTEKYLFFSIVRKGDVIMIE